MLAPSPGLLSHLQMGLMSPPTDTRSPVYEVKEKMAVQAPARA